MAQRLFPSINSTVSAKNIQRLDCNPKGPAVGNRTDSASACQHRHRAIDRPSIIRGQKRSRHRSGGLRRCRIAAPFGLDQLPVPDGRRCPGQLRSAAQGQSFLAGGATTGRHPDCQDVVHGQKNLARSADRESSTDGSRGFSTPAPITSSGSRSGLATPADTGVQNPVRAANTKDSGIYPVIQIVRFDSWHRRCASGILRVLHRLSCARTAISVLDPAWRHRHRSPSHRSYLVFRVQIAWIGAQQMVPRGRAVRGEGPRSTKSCSRQSRQRGRRLRPRQQHSVPAMRPATRISQDMREQHFGRPPTLPFPSVDSRSGGKLFTRRHSPG